MVVEKLDPERDREEWLEQRRGGIGGSEAAVILGANPWQSLFSLYHSKVSGISDVTDSPAMYWGRKLEGVVRDAYSEITERTVTDGVVMQRHQDSSLGFMIANTDGTIAPCGANDGPGVYEGKTSGVFTSSAWDDGIPLYYQIQVQHYIAVTGLDWGSVAVFIMGDRDPFHWQDVPRNDKFIEAMCESEYKFWHDNVIPRVAPPVDGSDSTSKILKILHPKDNGKIISLPSNMEALIESKKMLNDEIKSLSTQKRAIDNVLVAALGDNTYGRLGDGMGGLSYKTQFKAKTVQSVLEAAEELFGDGADDKIEELADKSRGTNRILRLTTAKALDRAEKVINGRQ